MPETLYPPADHGTKEEMDDDSMPSSIRKQFETLKNLDDEKQKRKHNDDTTDHTDDDDDESLQQKKRRVAVSTAISVENEVARLRNGIAELEARLFQQQQAPAANNEHVALLPFPALPPVVAAHVVPDVVVEDDTPVEASDQQHQSPLFMPLREQIDS